jgi:hypothetical protein
MTRAKSILFVDLDLAQPSGDFNRVFCRPDLGVWGVEKFQDGVQRGSFTNLWGRTRKTNRRAWKLISSRSLLCASQAQHSAEWARGGQDTHLRLQRRLMGDSGHAVQYLAGRTF